MAVSDRKKSQEHGSSGGLFSDHTCFTVGHVVIGEAPSVSLEWLRNFLGGISQGRRQEVQC